MDNKIHDLAIAYARVKLSEYNVDKRDGIASGNTDFSKDEIEYLQSAYYFAFNHLSE